MYIESAKQMRKRTVAGRQGKKKKARIEESPTVPQGQLWVSVARMRYDHKKSKGVQHKGETARKIFINKDAVYDVVLERVRKELYGQSDERGFEYYLSDTSGLPITTDGKIVVQKRDGTSESHVWTLKTWLAMSGIRYQSRARLFCVERTIRDNSDDLDSHSDSEMECSTSKDTQKPPVTRSSACSLPEQQTQSHMAEVDKDRSSSLPHIAPSSSNTNCMETVAVKIDQSVVSNQDFEPLFALFTKSRYEDKHVLKANLTQHAALMENRFTEDNDIEDESWRVSNPCAFDFLFYGVRTEDTVTVMRDFDMERGTLDLRTPIDGEEYQYWSGGYARCEVACLVCFALNGYHSETTYNWYDLDSWMATNPYPLLYTSKAGKYKCVMESGQVQHTQMFHVLGDDDDSIPNKVVMDPSSPPNSMYRHSNSITCNWKEVEKLSSSELDDTFPEIKLVEVVGEGNFGVVHKAVWRGTIVAAKVLNIYCGSEAVLKEIEMCRLVQHSNILCILGSILKGNKLVIVTNFVRGSNMHDLIFRFSSKLSFSIKKSLAVQVAQGLAFLHTSSPKLVHLDIKPANVLVESETYHAFIADFGVAKVLTQGTITTAKTKSSIVTPGFQPKEQLKAGKINTAVDIYAFGCLLIELFGEKQIWQGLSAIQIMVKVAVEGERPDLSHLPANIQTVCSNCLAEQDTRARACDVLYSLLAL